MPTGWDKQLAPSEIPEGSPTPSLSGVVHDFNNLLMVIRGHAELLTLRLGEQNPLHPLAQEVLTAADRAALLVEQLRLIHEKQSVAGVPAADSESAPRREATAPLAKQ